MGCDTNFKSNVGDVGPHPNIKILIILSDVWLLDLTRSKGLGLVLNNNEAIMCTTTWMSLIKI